MLQIKLYDGSELSVYAHDIIAVEKTGDSLFLYVNGIKVPFLVEAEFYDDIIKEWTEMRLLTKKPF